MKRASGVKALIVLTAVLVGFRLVLSWQPVSDVIYAFVTPLGSAVYNLNDVTDNKGLIIENNRIDLLQQENQELRNQLGINLKQENILGAEVIRIDIASYRKSVWVNKGRDGGISVNDPVLHNGYLFGKVVSVSNNTAEVQLITDPEFSTTAKYQQEHGVIKNRFGSVLFDLVPRGDIEQGKVIVTDGIDGVFKQGIPIAFVADNITQPGNVFFTYNVYLEENPSNVRFVEVLR